MKTAETLRGVLVMWVALWMHAAIAATPEEAARLKTTLTPFGGERAGSANGQIPAWEGGYTTVPPGYKSGDPRPDPFAQEKPVLSITAVDVDKYADNLSEGDKALFKKYHDFRMDVYPTHRTAAAPQWYYDNTLANSTRAKLTKDGSALEGAYGGVPFPIPANGRQAIWNHLLRWQGEGVSYEFSGYVTSSDGKRVLANQSFSFEAFPYAFHDGNLGNFNGDFFLNFVSQTEPAYKAGEIILFRDPVDFTQGRQAWQYLTGQRRVRKAPTIGYDTPNTVMSGQNNFDEVFGFLGSPDRYEWKIAGKRELYVPYNENRVLLARPDRSQGTYFMNPDVMRWELHRVWVIDATLAKGKRHVMPKRRFYLDEDTWAVLEAEGWDAKGELWKHTFTLPIIVPELPGVVVLPYGIYNLQTGSWITDVLFEQKPGAVYKVTERKPDGFFTPDSLATQGVR
jgi:hypothetical protein